MPDSDYKKNTPMHIRTLARLTRFALLGLAWQSPALALESLTDSDMSEVSAQDGLSLVWQGASPASQVTAQRIGWNVDCGGVANCAGAYASYPQKSSLNWNGISYGAIGLNGTAATVPWQVTWSADVGAANATSVGSYTQTLSWNRSRLKVNSSTLFPSSTTSFGSFVLDASGVISTSNPKWIFDNTCDAATTCAAFLDFHTSGAQFYYRQSTTAGDPELVLDNMNFSMDHVAGKVSLTAQGFRFAAPSVNVRWNYDLRYRDPASGATEFRADQGDLTNFFYFGLESGFINPILQVKPGGMWLSGSPQFDESVRNGGLNFSFESDLSPTLFALVFGEGGTQPTLVRFENWRSLKPGATALKIPNLTLDVVRGGGAGVPNVPNDFCIGADRAATNAYCQANFKDRDPTPYTTVSRWLGDGTRNPIKGDEGDAVVIAARDIQLLAYPTKVTIQDPTVAGDPNVIDPATGDIRSFNWGVVFTTNNLDATLVAYPGTGAAGTTGLRFDAVVSATTPRGAPTTLFPDGDWDESLGTHFLLADTDSNNGVGFLNLNYMITINNMTMTLLPTMVKFSCATAGATCVSWYSEGQFGGGDLFNLSDATKVARGFDLIIRLNFSEFEINLIPQTNKLGYSGKLTLDSNVTAQNYVMLTEPDYNDAAFTFGMLSGSVDITNGEINILPSNATADANPRLMFKQDMTFTQHMKVDDIAFNGKTLGRLVIPAGGTLHGEMALKPQL